MVIIVAGCGVHTSDGHDARHNGIHRFFIGKGAHILYKEKHIGTGKGVGKRTIDPVTDAYLEDDAVLEMDTIQLSGVDSTVRKPGGITFDPAGNPSFNLQLGDIRSTEATLDEIFRYLEKASRPVIVAIDEFQQVAYYTEKTVATPVLSSQAASGTSWAICSPTPRAPFIKACR